MPVCLSEMGIWATSDLTHTSPLEPLIMSLTSLRPTSPYPLFYMLSSLLPFWLEEEEKGTHAGNAHMAHGCGGDEAVGGLEAVGRRQGAWGGLGAGAGGAVVRAGTGRAGGQGRERWFCLYALPPACPLLHSFPVFSMLCV